MLLVLPSTIPATPAQIKRAVIGYLPPDVTERPSCLARACLRELDRDKASSWEQALHVYQESPAQVRGYLRSFAFAPKEEACSLALRIVSQTCVSPRLLSRPDVQAAAPR